MFYITALATVVTGCFQAGATEGGRQPDWNEQDATAIRALLDEGYETSWTHTGLRPSHGGPFHDVTRRHAVEELQVRVHKSADIAELPADTGDELVGEQMMRPSATDELVEFDRTGRRDRRRPIVIGVRARGAGDEPISCARSGLDA